ncbi:hypothetical protein HYH03_018539 [Edaphochlamys debaryana]|uniref:Uncharacterized protein n=1 Tax=Edaphochlamys debaryana TaxID=47281 RepID=A0A836BPF7_9CHLO|nr:hypothetical protein HYH03_018539 [Edaphochlamys debaryana]|eukprot:KAG2482548.1 hypothetical protein HYH03_018539 [Edaphochlamys debaryana]
MRVHSPDDTPGRVFLRAYISALRACADDGEGARQASLRKAEKAAGPCGEKSSGGGSEQDAVVKAEGGQGAASCDKGGKKDCLDVSGGPDGVQCKRKRKGGKVRGGSAGGSTGDRGGGAVSSKRPRTSNGGSGSGSRSSPRSRNKKGNGVKQEAQGGNGEETPAPGPLLDGPSAGGAAEGTVASPAEAPGGAEKAAAALVPSSPRVSDGAAANGPSPSASEALLEAPAPALPPAVTSLPPPPPPPPPPPCAQPSPPPSPHLHATDPPAAPLLPLLAPSPSLDSCLELLSDLCEWEEDSTPPPPPSVAPLQCPELPLAPPPTASPSSPQSSPSHRQPPRHEAAAGLGSRSSSYGLPEAPVAEAQPEPQVSDARPTQLFPAPSQPPPWHMRRPSEAGTACGTCLLSSHLAAHRAAVLDAASRWPSPLPPRAGPRSLLEPPPAATLHRISSSAESGDVWAATAAELNALLEELAEAEVAASGTLLKLPPARKALSAVASLLAGSGRSGMCALKP